MRTYTGLISIILILLAFGCGLDNKMQQPGVKSKVLIECDAESWEGDKLLDKSGKYKLSNANGRSDEEKRSGKYSLKLVKEIPYGMTIVLDNVHPDEFFRVTAWQKGDGHICASDDIPEGFYLATGNPVETDSLGWQKLSLEFYIPHNYSGSKIKLLLANFGNAPVYFDDLIIEWEREKEFPQYNSREVMNIFISEENFRKISLKRQEAIEQGLLVTEDDDWVKAIIFYKDKVLDTRLRLKGDRLDHLMGKKWSFRIKIKGNNSWKGMRTFSIQTPKARNFIHEWFFHKALEKEDLLCTRYGFVPVVVNGQSLGVYAWEEHFEKHLVEARDRREGPIMKLSDDSYWINDKIRRQREVSFSIPSYDASVILPFDAGSYATDSLLMSEFKYGRDLYQQYKYARGSASGIFDLETVAKYYAMTDATNAYHTLHFFNQRFYYNPVIGKLEPIFFDSFADVGIFDYNGYDLLIENAGNTWLNIHLKLFADQEFRELYFKYLDKYSSRKYWEELYSENKEKIESLNNVIKQEFRDYNFDVNVFYDIAERARAAMLAFKESTGQEDIFSKFRTREQNINRNYSGKADFEILPHLVNVYLQNERSFYIENYSTDTIIITGFSDIPQVKSEKLGEEIVLPPANSGGGFTKSLFPEDNGHNFVFVKIRGQEVSIPVIPWDPPNEKIKYTGIQKSFDTEQLERAGNVHIESDTVYFEGDITIENHLAIPRGMAVVFKKGAQVDLINGATFISYSPVYIRGSESEPVVFRSSDQTGKGINIFQAEGRSKVEHAVFTGLANLNFGGWVTTTAVCFYESDVDLFNVRFEKNVNCDDALNIIRSDYLINNCIFEDTFADAFDSDFCTGKINATRFINPGNDAIDFSGSVVVLNNCSVADAGDKGISCGEASKITVTSSKIDGANIGVASKDNSEVRFMNSEMNNITYGLVAFCKKPEYGPADITVEDLTIKKYLFIHLIEEGSTLNFNRREIFGQERNLASRFY